MNDNNQVNQEEQRELRPSFDTIDELERQLKIYKDRINQLQCWQSSMRDPERKIVCDILANGFTLTTKEDVTHTDALALLEVWVRYESERGFKNYNHSQVVIAVCGMIDSIRADPKIVLKNLKEKGAWDK